MEFLCFCPRGMIILLSILHFNPVESSLKISRVFHMDFYRE